MDKILELSNVRKEYRGFTLDDITFSLERGYIMGFIGPNGSGKTTTIKAIMNLIKKDAGEIRVFGLDHLQAEKEIKQRIGFVYDENHFYEDLSIREMKRIIAPFYRQWDDELYNHYVKEFALPEKRKIKDLSRGMQMKFSLALALSHNAELIIMDEPTSGLDPVFRNELLDILSALLQDENRGIVFSTHITSDLDKIADYITFIKDGRIVFSDDKDSILENYVLVKGERELLCPEIRELFIGIKENSFGFEALSNEAERLDQLFSGRLLLERASLEDIMIYTIRGDKNA